MKKNGTIRCRYSRNRQCDVWQRLKTLERRCQELEALSMVDPLTGYYNYRYLMGALANEMERTRRSGFPTGLIMIDLDHFKTINDTFGHANGNIAIAHATALWQKTIRKIDIPCRYGGEEFVIVLPQTSLAHAVSTAERLRFSLENEPVLFNHRPLRLTASLGVDVYVNQDFFGVDDFLHETDQLLYDAKASGRNRVCSKRDRMKRSHLEIRTEDMSVLYRGE